jgi:peptidoglycan/LPS O-acetylase OafA/YrhL
MRWLTEQFELYRGGGARVAPMEGLRGFAVLLVFLVHYATAIAPWLPAGKTLALIAVTLHAVGNAGVDLFFVLSGYLIYGALMRRPQPYRAFIARRLRRIYPAFTAVFLLYLLLSRAFPLESRIPPGLFDGAIYLAKNYLLLNGFNTTPPMIAVAWSLSYELLYYLLLPPLIAAARLRHRSARWRVGLVLLLLAAGAAIFTLTGGPLRLLMFIAGILLHESLAAGARPWHAGAALAALPAALAALTLPGWPLLKTAALFCAFYLLCHCCFAAPRSRLGRLFAWTPLRWLGNMSFSFYLLHGLAVNAGLRAVAALRPPPAAEAAAYFWALLPMTLMLAIAVSAVLFLLVERPLSLVTPRARPGSARSGARESS